MHYFFYSTVGGFGAPGAPGAFGDVGADGEAGGSRLTRPSVGVLQNGHLEGSSPATRLIFFPQFAQITGSLPPASAGLKHIAHLLSIGINMKKYEKYSHSPIHRINLFANKIQYLIRKNIIFHLDKTYF
jgi:hypothetical protein